MYPETLNYTKKQKQFIDSLNIKQIKQLTHFLQNKKSKKHLQPKTTFFRKNLVKKISKTATLSLLATPLVVDWRTTLFIIGNFLFYLYYLYFCKMVDKRNQERIQKMKKYEDKPDGVKKRMANLKQFKKPSSTLQTLNINY